MDLKDEAMKLITHCMKDGTHKVFIGGEINSRNDTNKIFEVINASSTGNTEIMFFDANIVPMDIVELLYVLQRHGKSEGMMQNGGYQLFEKYIAKEKILKENMLNEEYNVNYC